MKTKNLALSLVAIILGCSIGYSQFQDNSNTSDGTLPLKQAKGRLKAIAREYMIENQKIKKPFDLHQNWRLIKKDIYKQLDKESYRDQQNQRVVNDYAIPEMANNVFIKLAKLRTDSQGERRKKYTPPPELISMKSSVALVRDRLRKQGIVEKDRPILFKKIMEELKHYKEEENMINKTTVKTIADTIIKKFKEHKLNVSTQPQSYLEQFIADSYKKRFEDQIRQQDWSVIP